jgi:hypothetical protein
MKYSTRLAHCATLLTACVALSGCDRKSSPVDKDPILAKSPGASPIAAQQPSLRDADIAKAVRSELEHDGGVAATGIQVDCDAGVVELTGKGQPSWRKPSAG